MQRICAALLLAVFSSSLLTPLLVAATPSSVLPACCRKDGKHHCSMDNMKQESSDSAAKLVSGKCSQFPSIGSIPITANATAVVPVQAFLAYLISHPASQAQTEARYRISFSRSSQKRGPPASNPLA